LVGAIDGLAIAIKARNEMIENREPHNGMTKRGWNFSLGLRSATGVIDQRFPTNLAAITAQTDFCIFYAKTLATDLAQYANNLRWKEKWFYRLRVPKIDETNWSNPEKMGLMPKEDDYRNWLRGFQPQPTKWQIFRASFKSEKHAT